MLFSGSGSKQVLVAEGCQSQMCCVDVLSLVLISSVSTSFLSCKSLDRTERQLTQCDVYLTTQERCSTLENFKEGMELLCSLSCPLHKKQNEKVELGAWNHTSVSPRRTYTHIYYLDTDMQRGNRGSRDKQHINNVVEAKLNILLLYRDRKDRKN